MPNTETDICCWNAEDCFARHGKSAVCKILTDISFPDRLMCPFYKSTDTFQKMMVEAKLRETEKEEKEIAAAMILG